MWNGDTYFVKVGSDLFWSINCDYGEFSVVQPVRNRKHYEFLVNERLKRERDELLLTDVMFADEKYSKDYYV